MSGPETTPEPPVTAETQVPAEASPAAAGQLQFGHVVLSKLYGLAWRLARPVLRRNKRLADGFDRRLVPDDWSGPVDLWLQAASGGEAYLLWEVLAALPVSETPLRVLATTWTRQGLEVLQGMAATFKQSRPDLDVRVTLFPLDQPSLMYRAVKMAAPRAVVLLETELWPGLLFACRRCKVPVMVLNGRLSDNSARNYRLMNWFAPGFWSAVGPVNVSAMSAADARRFKSLVPEDRVSVAPNIKFDRALSALTALEGGGANAAAVRSLGPLLPAGVPVLLLASVREQEETTLASIVQALRARHPEAVIIVAPRHMHRVDAWFQHLAGQSLRLRSALTPELPAHAGQVVIWNRFGELSSLYALSHVVFIGGSLAPLGGQNFLEALACGRVPHTGPHLRNFLWALDETAGPDSLTRQNLIRIAPTAKDLENQLNAALQAPSAVESPETIRQRFTRWLEARKGGAQQSADLLHRLFSSK